MSERILGPAIRHNGVVFSRPAPQRHHNILHDHAVKKVGIIVSSLAGGEQGFYTDQREFIDRLEGKKVALASGQNLRNTGPAHVLFTEDMW